MIAEKFIDEKIYSNIVMKIYERKEIEGFNKEDLLEIIDLVCGEDANSMFEKGISLNYYDGGVLRVEMDIFYDYIVEYLEENKSYMNINDIDKHNEMIKRLEPYMYYDIVM
ncbi:MAG: hypothetical protein EOL97_14430 [Spirochaetia bacterium]|nr:hypothetical protein [Spirochaetia bacterium]